jgi:RNase adapter protein RapZ
MGDMAVSKPPGLGSRLRLRRRRQARTEAPAPAGTRLSDLVVITGFSGAGKSTAMQVFEDAGYFCVDNLPPEMIRSLTELFMHEGSKVERAAVVSDVRGGSYFDAMARVIDDLDGAGLEHRVLFLEADEQALLNRYKETRRRHPLAGRGRVSDGIAAERRLLAPLRERAHAVIDTTGIGATSLRRKIAEEMLPSQAPTRMAVSFTSFGHKHGPLREADLAFDVRFLPNPHYVAALRPLTGHDPRVVEYVSRDGQLDELYTRLIPLIDWLLPQYAKEGKAHLVVAIGCTGGRHRSVAIAEHLGRLYRERDEYVIDVSHRDAERPPREARGPSAGASGRG